MKKFYVVEYLQAGYEGLSHIGVVAASKEELAQLTFGSFSNNNRFPFTEDEVLDDIMEETTSIFNVTELTTTTKVGVVFEIHKEMD